MKPDRLGKSILANLDVLPFPVPSDNTVATPCLQCSWPLTLHLPDPGLPERLLGVCERCKHWYLIDLLPDLTQGVQTRLPGHEVLRDLTRENPSDGISLMGHEPDPDPR